MKRIYTENKGVLFLYVLFILLGGGIVILQDKVAIHLAMNTVNNAFLDYFFMILTHLGDGLTVVGIIVFLFLFSSYYKGLLLGVNALIMGLVVGLLKHKVFHSYNRPFKVFKTLEQNLNLVLSPEEMHHYNSFPSGHTAAAFSLYIMLAFFTTNKALKYFWFITAFLVGYSRIYLSQHFLMDVVFGAFIGGVSAIVVYWLFESQTTLSKKPKWNRAIFRK